MAKPSKRVKDAMKEKRKDLKDKKTKRPKYHGVELESDDDNGVIMAGLKEVLTILDEQHEDIKALKDKALL